MLTCDKLVSVRVGGYGVGWRIRFAQMLGHYVGSRQDLLLLMLMKLGVMVMVRRRWLLLLLLFGHHRCYHSWLCWENW